MAVANMTPAFNLTDLDHQLLAMTDEEFVYHDWEDLKDIIARNDLGAFRRKPSDLRRYLAWSADTKAQYGSIMNYICQRRLQWQMPLDSAGSAAIQRPVAAFKNPRPFADPEDYKILRNDWPYGLTPGISHLVVWLRTPIAVKSEEGHLTDESRLLIDTFVQQTFVDRLAKDPRITSDAASHVLWFKNWVGLQSVRALEHVHILVRDVPEDILFEWSGEA
ncbi:hypothetical protein N7499_003934 [Penicillium canescens]|uniref:N-acetylglucosamine-induced protein 1 n=1 Tax=Penicillium canescens TaxID=5083 RepID=A0AAD6NDL3_PENCN|nr:uncharacterized protein N7446_007441 [Penicillium canescens]KAJ5991517.1 hypothetical protein N7522_011724 [Penicillium canescens]KAJ6049230.1 hypothetical protein N7444_005946 [Penicillium canescens]KAJ6052798.1 hypothetical protein N7460_003332 [Penicillium canescens]KAJ6063321.1 hypothetical protein N7446_007441 [Penicillium canescens]KAJ6089087.1 hypothetical protein N7499_003934 [Penicillium canescens]